MAGKNVALGHAKEAKNDEFYTQYADIEKEINAYLDFDKDVFRGKTVLLPCDDPEWSNFTKYFAQNFKALGLKKLISTSYAIGSKRFKSPYQPTLWEKTQSQFDPSIDRVHGKIYILDSDRTGDGKVDLDDLHYEYLEGDGDYDSDEVKELRNQSDVIITNPPFSQFRRFFTWLVETDKRFLIIANKNCVTYKEVFPLIKANKIWSGATEWSGGMWFETKDPTDVDKVIDGVNMKNVPSIWITNIDHGRRHTPLRLMTMHDNLKYSVHKDLKGLSHYFHYENYDAIEVPHTDAIPSDYKGTMGVPRSFLDKYCPEQFEIIGTAEGESGKALGLQPFNRALKKDNPSLRDGQLYYLMDGKPIKPYARILIRAKKASKGGKK